MSENLTLLALLRSALAGSDLWEGDEREEVAQAMGASVTEGVLKELIDEDATRGVGERLQEAILSGEDMLAVAQQEGIAQDDAFAEAFGNALAEVLNEIIEVSDADDASALRRHLHEAIITKMQENIEAS